MYPDHEGFIVSGGGWSSGSCQRMCILDCRSKDQLKYSAPVRELILLHSGRTGAPAPELGYVPQLHETECAPFVAR